MYNEEELKDIVQKFETKEVNDTDIINLIKKIVDSGEQLSFSMPVYDFASTGGPSSLSTLLVPLYLFGSGCNVIDLGVPGRPAGAIDVLAQIDGYDTTVKPNMVCESNTYFHIEAGDKIVPLDKELYQFRKKYNKVNLPNIAIASLLSKKVACGAKIIGLDIRVAKHGNFGTNWDLCKENAIRYNRIANYYGIKSTCFLSDANSPYQNYIGRGESLIALFNIFNGICERKLQEHVDYCAGMAETLLGENTNIRNGNAIIDIKKAFEANLEQQGSCYDNFLEAVERVKKQSYQTIVASQSGYIKFNLLHIRDYIVRRQINITEVRYPDPCGVVLLINDGDYIHNNTPIMKTRNIPQEECENIFYKIVETKMETDCRREIV
ncbi:MAG: hypothetical protein HDR03_06150 [Lachnospiraceae bacterium]|nr:hypothetical protein [Lachnospiraceae bacterium]